MFYIMHKRFREQTVESAWERAGGKCERCEKQLAKKNRGREGRGCWETHRKNTSKGNELSNCEILCFACHANTRSFGRSHNQKKTAKKAVFFIVCQFLSIIFIIK